MNNDNNNNNKKTNKLIYDKWINNSSFEENTTNNISTKNEYSTISYKIWLNVKNYLENTSSDNNKPIKKINTIKNKIKIYMIYIMQNIFSFQ